jgi:hypothetical protein
MPLVVKDRVRENSITSGTGTITLTGAVTSFQTFSSAIGNGNTTYYTITEQNTANFEVGIGTVGAGTLTRDTVLESSNGGTKVNFGSAAKDVFCTYPAEKSVDIDTPQTLTNKTINASQLVDGSITTAKIANNAITSAKMANGGAEFGMRNRIINGAMTINQRATSITSSGYTVDRFGYFAGQASKATVAQSSVAPAGFINSLLVTSSSAYTVLAGDIFELYQVIEGLNISDLGWGTANAQPVTLSFWVRSSLTGTFGGALNNNGLSRSYPFNYTISAANTWEQKTITIAGDTSGTWLTTNGTGIQINWGLGVGSTYSGTAGAWASATYASATGATSVVGTNGATFYITGVQLEKGSQATAFDYRPYGTELALCQRYYESGQNIKIGAQTQSTYFTFVPVTFVCSKRASPTVSFSGTAFSGTITTLAVADITTNGFNAQFTASGVGAGQGSGIMTATAEL